MRTILLFLACLISGMLTAQTIDNPTFKVRTGSTTNITRIERTPEVTKLFIHAIFRPHWWIMEEGSSYLVDVASGTKYPFVKAEGIELKKKTFMPDSGEMDYVLHFAPLPKTTATIHLLNPEDTEGNTYDISLVPAGKTKKNLLAAVKGNWYKADNSNNWEYGIYDSISILQNRIFTNTSIRQKGKRIEMTVNDKQNGNTATLTLVPQKNGNLLISLNGESERTYTRQKSTLPVIAPEEDFTEFLKKDTAYLQGYIDGYDPRLNFETGLVYLNNTFNREDFPTVIKIHPDGCFEGKFVLNHPIESALALNRIWIPFYIEPGQTLTMYIDWEAILAYNRARNYDLPIKNIEYMGPYATLSQMYQSHYGLFRYPYEQLEKDQKTLTPDQFKESMQPIFAQWNQTCDSLAKIYASSAKAVHLLKNKKALKQGGTLFEFLMSRDYYAKQDTANLVLKVKEDDSYYNFLKDIPINDEVMLTDNSCDIFINRFEYMNPLRRKAALQRDSIDMSYPAKSLLTFFKEKGIKLSSEQEELRVQQEKLAGKTVRQPIGVLQKTSQIISELYQKEKDLLKEYYKLYPVVMPKQTDEEKDMLFFNNNKNDFAYKDSIVGLLSGQANSLFMQTAMVRELDFKLKNYKTRKWAEIHVNSLSKQLTYPILITESQRLLNKIHPENALAKSYQLPTGKAAEVFRNIIKAHAGKVLFVDFWATSCGPCRAGIEATAQLRTKYKDHLDFQFVYITSEKESPQTAYDSYVAKNLKGEASYRVSETEFNYLRELFKFNGIPHYELVEKDGSISTSCPGSWNLEGYLEQRFETTKPL